MKGEQGGLRGRSGVIGGLLAIVAAAGSMMPCPTPAAALPSATEHVVVLHGLGRTDRSMQVLAERVATAGYSVYNLNYPSLDLTPEELVAVVADAVETCCATASRVHFVTHSLGGLLVRAYLATRPDLPIGRVIMLSPPNRGSELVDVLGGNWFFSALMGPTAIQLGTGNESFPNRLPAPDFEVGVIAATGSINPLGSVVIPGEDDGTVSLCSMWIEGVTDLVTVPDSHTFVMRSPEVADLTIRFLRSGRFKGGAGDLPADFSADCGEGDARHPGTDGED